uniref:Uncharacterized protein n=1 Tax=Schlesneria paludicola TaxID=360056 RepID=A0A7C2NY54_9PLAN
MLTKVGALGVLIAASLLGGLPNEASAGIGGKSYFTFVKFADLGNTDCFRFEEDGTFVASYGLIVGEWSEEGLLFFTYYEVEIDSPENPLFTVIEFMDGMLIVGRIETDDGDSGFFVGIESMICDIPARPTGRTPTSKTDSRADDAHAPACCGAGLETAIGPPVDATRPSNARR